MATKKEVTSLGVSSRTQLNLRGLVAEQQEAVARNKATGQHRLEGGVKRPDKKPSKWMLSNRGVHKRATRDIELEEIPRASIDSGLANLALKAKSYKKQVQGKSGGLDDNQIENSLVDFDQERAIRDWGSDDSDEPVPVPRPQSDDNDDDDPIMEYEDDFGRTRNARRSEIPPEFLPKPNKEQEDDFDPLRLENPIDHFPMYQPTEDRLQEVEEKFAEENNPLETHFDSTREVRDYGAAHYQFSKNEETRKEQMESLAGIRQEAKQNRDELEAPNVPAGVVGMQGESESTKSRAAEKRKRLLEERNKQLEAKRKKRKAGEDSTLVQIAPTAGPSTVPQPPTKPAPNDPFAAVEAQTSKKNIQSQSVNQEANAADDFLAKLEQDVLLKHRAH